MPKFILILTRYTTAVLTLLLPVVAQAQVQESEEVEMLDVFEVSGTAIQKESRQQHFPTPSIDTLHSFPDEDWIRTPPTLEITRTPVHSAKIVTDPIGKIRGIRTSVKPINAPRPSYPRFAREQGWEGTAVVRVTIDDRGKVTAATTQKSSGFPLLDESAIQTVNQWGFLPAKNGEFVVKSVVDIPIHFDLDQSP